MCWYKNHLLVIFLLLCMNDNYFFFIVYVWADCYVVQVRLNMVILVVPNKRSRLSSLAGSHFHKHVTTRSCLFVYISNVSLIRTWCLVFVYISMLIFSCLFILLDGLVLSWFYLYVMLQFTRLWYMIISTSHN